MSKCQDTSQHASMSTGSKESHIPFGNSSATDEGKMNLEEEPPPVSEESTPLKIRSSIKPLICLTHSQADAKKI